MESEVRTKNPTNGKPEWKRIGKRHNHLWDCEVMQFVPALAFGFLIPPQLQANKDDQPEVSTTPKTEG